MDQETVVLAAPLVTGLVEAMKRGGLPTQYAGVAAVVCGVAVSVLLVPDPTSREAAATGIATGLSAMGLYSQIDHWLAAGGQEAVPDGRID